MASGSCIDWSGPLKVISINERYDQLSFRMGSKREICGKKLSQEGNLFSSGARLPEGAVS